MTFVNPLRVTSFIAVSKAIASPSIIEQFPCTHEVPAITNFPDISTDTIHTFLEDEDGLEDNLCICATTDALSSVEHSPSITIAIPLGQGSLLVIVVISSIIHPQFLAKAHS
ncbi:unnamed protein product [Trifolium pratense]|uniref:Uncharacterized protein n=1 Tax=Trifolium pratense TaxID=57577 RepID=A0ACB0IUD6_TRIPR|nr:unnamed protein product [Trifolium pratense]